MDPAGRVRAREQSQPEFQQHWRVERGELVNDGEGAYLTTDEEFGDIELLHRVQDRRQGRQRHLPPRQPAGADLGHDRRRAASGTAAPTRAPAACSTTPRARPAAIRWCWPTSRSASGTVSASCRSASGRSVWLNGKLVVDGARMENFWDRKLPLCRSGPIQLQTHGGEIRWRNLFAPRDPAPRRPTAILGEARREGFDGRLQRQGLRRLDRARSTTTRSSTGRSCASRRRAANIYTKEEYGDFGARLEYQLPPGGNNGLAIRYPGEGDSRICRRCASCRSSTTTSPKVRASSIRGSTTGRSTGWSPAQRGYLRAGRRVELHGSDGEGIRRSRSS